MLIPENSTKDPYVEDASSGLWCLSLLERERYDRYQSLEPRCVADVGQDPAHRALRSKRGVLHTFIRGMGALILPPAFEHRHMTCRELWACMGFPVTAEAVRLLGVSCQFRQGIKAERRTVGSQRQQIGNSMHLNFIGSVILTVILHFETLGERGRGVKRAAEGASTSSA